MTAVVALTGRNLRLFFRDGANVFFSLLAAIILFGLYVLFLANLQVLSLRESFPGAGDAELRAFVDAWMFAGIVAITAITTALGSLASFIEDSAAGRFRDFLVSPVHKWQLVLGYLLSTIIISITMTVFTLVVSYLYLGLAQGLWLPADAVLRILGYVVLITAAFGALWAFVASFVKSAGAFGALSTVVGTLIGFAAAAYIPVGLLPSAVGDALNALPFAQPAMLLRREFTAGTLETLTGGHEQAVAALQEFYGITASVGAWEVTPVFVLLVLFAMTIVFSALAAWRMRTRIV